MRFTGLEIDMDENDRLQDSIARYAAPEERHCPSDIYDCAACGKSLSFAVDPEGEALDGCGELVCLGCALAYMVDMATGELRRAPALLEAKDAEIARLTAERDDMIAEQQAALSGLIAERDAARRGAEELRAYLRGDAGSIGIADAALVADHDVRRNAGMVAALDEMRTDRDGLRRALAVDKATP